MLSLYLMGFVNTPTAQHGLSAGASLSNRFNRYRFHAAGEDQGHLIYRSLTFV
jgi:hypothetical protein